MTVTAVAKERRAATTIHSDVDDCRKANRRRRHNDSINRPVSPEDERDMLAAKLSQVTLLWEADCRRRRLVKSLDAAIRRKDADTAMRIGTRLCAMDAHFVFGMFEKEYLKSRSI